jgi:predicted transcriptional regulator
MQTTNERRRTSNGTPLKLEKAFMKDLLEAYPKPKPATTTIATLLKRMIDKQFVATMNGNSRNIILWSRKPIISRNTSTD